MSTDLRTTYQDYCALPDDGPRYQLIEGELVETSPSPTWPHQRIVFALARALANFVDARRLGTVAVAPLDVVLSSENVFQPDVLFVSNSRRALLQKEGVKGAPDLCVEVLSPANYDKYMSRKREIYAKFGVIELWIADLDARTVELYRLQENAAASARTFGGKDILVSPLLPGFELDLERVFG